MTNSLNELLPMPNARAEEIKRANPIINAVEAAAYLRFNGYRITAKHLENLGPKSGLSYLYGGTLGKNRGYIPSHLLWWAENVMNKPKRKN